MVRNFGTVLLTVSFVVLLVCGCAGEEQASSDDGTVVIGFSVSSDDFLIERWNKDIQIFSSRARELGAEVILSKSPGDALAQIPQIQYLMDQNVDVIVVIPEDMDLLSGIIKKALDRGIPVLSYDRPVMGVPLSGYISFDNNAVGKILATALTEEVPEGKYLVVNGSVRDNNSFEINEGAHEIFNPFIESGDIEVAEEIWLDYWSFDEALKKIDIALNAHPDISAIFCANDILASAAVQLLAQRRLAGKIAVVGQDADILACQRIVQGTQLMTAYKPIANLAGRAASIAVQLARGEYPTAEQVFDNGSPRAIPFYVEEPIAVFDYNIDETVIKDGFHSADDVYREVLGQN